MKKLIRQWADMMSESKDPRFADNDSGLATMEMVRNGNSIMQAIDPQRYSSRPFEYGKSTYFEVWNYIKVNHKKVDKSSHEEKDLATEKQVEMGNIILKRIFPSKYKSNPFVYGKTTQHEVGPMLMRFKYIARTDLN